MKHPRNLNGYRTIYNPDHPRAMRGTGYGGFVYEHILVAERFMGRPLTSDEVCHHLNGNRSDNRPENILVLSRGQHSKLHMWMKKGAPGIERFGVERVNSGKSKGEELQTCLTCGQYLRRTQKRYCSMSCRADHQSRCPDKATLIADRASMSREAVGRKYGVSGNAVKKWEKKLGLL